MEEIFLLIFSGDKRWRCCPEYLRAAVTLWCLLIVFDDFCCVVVVIKKFEPVDKCLARNARTGVGW